MPSASPSSLLLVLVLVACHGPVPAAAREAKAIDGGGGGGARLPLVRVADVDLPGGSTRFDYQDVDTARGQLVVTHMNDASVLVLDLATGAVRAELKGIQRARGVVVAPEKGLVFVTAAPDQLVTIDAKSLREVRRAGTGHAPDGVGWDGAHEIVGVSDQKDGALSLIANAGAGARTQVPLGRETGNVVYDASRGWFWITVVKNAPPDALVAVDPTTAKVAASIPVGGCAGAHGLRIHPDGRSALVACEDNSMLARVELDGAHGVTLGSTGKDPDVLAVDPGLGWLYVAAESGDLTVFDLSRSGVALVGHDHPGDDAHTVAVDPATHRVFFPLMHGPKGTAALRVLRPSE
jgi:DNA-binding beta-propeller fold protein YncE